MSAYSAENRPGVSSFVRGGAARMVVVGVVGWALAALFIRYANSAGLFKGVTEIALFGLNLPVAWVSARALRRGGGLSPNRIVPAMAICLIAALFLDGVALTAAPWIYGTTDRTLLPAAAWLLFGVGAFLTAALLESKRDTAAA